MAAPMIVYESPSIMTIDESSPCPPGWSIFDSKCLYVGGDVVNYKTASTICRHKNSVVYTPRNKNKIYLPSIIQEKMPSASHWIGYNLKLESQIHPNSNLNFPPALGYGKNFYLTSPAQIS
jgi:hypothetical protein